MKTLAKTRVKPAIFDRILSQLGWFISLTSKGSLVQSQSCPPTTPRLSAEHFKKTSNMCHKVVTQRLCASGLSEAMKRRYNTKIEQHNAVE